MTTDKLPFPFVGASLTSVFIRRHLCLPVYPVSWGSSASLRLCGSIISARDGAGELGQLQGANGSVRGITELIGLGLFIQSLAFFIAVANPVHLPGAPFLLASLLLATAIPLAWRMTQPQ